jgi:hypothetical protein
MHMQAKHDFVWNVFLASVVFFALALGAASLFPMRETAQPKIQSPAQHLDANALGRMLRQKYGILRVSGIGPIEVEYEALAVPGEGIQVTAFVSGESCPRWKEAVQTRETLLRQALQAVLADLGRVAGGQALSFIVTFETIDSAKPVAPGQARVIALKDGRTVVLQNVAQAFYNPGRKSWSMLELAK